MSAVRSLPGARAVQIEPLPDNLMVLADRTRTLWERIGFEKSSF